MADFIEQLESLREGGEHRVAMATLVAARGGSPRPLGAKLFVGEGGRLLGSVSIGGCVDARVVEHGERLLKENRSERVTVVVDDAEALELGLACGAEFDLIIEPISLNGDDPAVLAYESAARISRSGNAAFVVTSLSGGVTPNRAVFTDVVLAAHEYKYELPILREALRSPVRYVGMLAGRKRADAVRSLLREEGLSDEEIGRLHSPIGLDIGGREPQEIALSIAAQLVAVREAKPIARRA
jgi:xanthine dehydrogenase accessory factor